jgi:hypothetical protein
MQVAKSLLMLYVPITGRCKRRWGMVLAVTALILNVVLISITGYYAWMNRQAVVAMRQQVQAATRPYITIRTHISAGRPIIQLTISNDGRSSAENLAVRLDRDVLPFGTDNKNENLRAKPFFRDVIATFAPGATMAFDLVEAYKELSENGEVPAVFSINASYGAGAVRFEEVTRIDLRAFEGSLYPYDPIHSELEKIRAVLEKKLK